MAGTRPVALGATTQRCGEGHQRPLRTRRTPAERRRLEQALEAALSVVEAAVTLLDAMDGDADLEPACEDEGYDSDSEPDADAEPTLGAREDGHGGTAWSLQDAGCPPFECEPDGRTSADLRAARARVTLTPRAWGGFSLERRPAVWVRASSLVDPDEAPDLLQPTRYGYGCAR